MKRYFLTILIFFGVFCGSLTTTFLIGENFFNQSATSASPQVTQTFLEPKLAKTNNLNEDSRKAIEYLPLTSLNQLNLHSNEKTNPNLISLLVTGDVLLARSVNSKMTQLNDFTWPFHKTKDKLQSADITFINLETPLIDTCPLRSDGMIFCGDKRGVEGLILAGVDIANLANNHIGNWEEEGVNSTVEFLHNAQIDTAGLKNIVVKNVKGIKFAFLGFNEVNTQVGVPALTEELLRTQINEAKKVADVIIVQFHWGQEYTYQPTSNQKKWAHLAIDNGADLIVGNHPHWWQPAEFYQNKLIVYSHGNFIFDQMWSYETREGLVGEYLFDGKDLVDVKFHPVLIEDYGQPRWLEGQEKIKVISHFLDESKKQSL